MSKAPEFKIHPASYRDPSGFVFRRGDVLYRQVNQSFNEHFDFFIASGLYEKLVQENLLIRHTVLAENLTGDVACYATLQPQKIPVITYPYEWCFDLLKDAALLTLTLAEKAMQHEMMLKDASPYNVQLHNGKSVFIDTLSFEKLDTTKPWIAYRQFCEAFLAPLAIMHFLKTPLQSLILAYPDGIPLQVAEKLLPLTSRFQLGIYLHLHLHARYASGAPTNKTQTSSFSKQKLQRIIHSLKQTITSLRLDAKTQWAGYYNEAAQRQDYLHEKKNIISGWISDLPQLKTAIDVGANEGLFAELLAAKDIFTVAADSDHFSINALYKKIKNENIKNVVPVVADLANPSPALGVNNEEHAALTERMQSDLVLALALIHHLCIGKNISFALVALLFKRLGTYLLIEFVPKEDKKVREVLAYKKDVYDWYTQQNFEASFQRFFKTIRVQEINPSGRTLYLMQQHEA